MRTIIIGSILWLLSIIYLKNKQREAIRTCVRAGYSIIFCEEKTEEEKASANRQKDPLFPSAKKQ